jgi:PTH1 family peptidyl-tRNA hydrolase
MARIIIGLGNPGREYDGSRHNVGFRVADVLAKKLGAEYRTNRKFAAEVAEVKRNESAWVLAKPLTYMNLSGQAAAALRDWYKCTPQDVVAIFDDADLKLGQLRVRGSGSSGGHRGVQSLIDLLGSDEFARVRLGIGRTSRGDSELVDHVLSRFTKEEEPLVREMVDRAVEAVECLLERGLTVAMNQFNQRTKETE